MPPATSNPYFGQYNASPPPTSPVMVNIVQPANIKPCYGQYIIYWWLQRHFTALFILYGPCYGQFNITWMLQCHFKCVRNNTHIVHNSLHFNHWKCQPCHMRLGCQLFALHSATLNLWSVYTGPRSIHTKSVPCQTNPDTQIKAEPVYTVIYTVIKTVPKYVQCNLKKSMTSQWQEAEAYFSAYVRGRGGRRSGTFLTVKSTTTTTTTTTYWRQ